MLATSCTLSALWFVGLLLQENNFVTYVLSLSAIKVRHRTDLPHQKAYDSHITNSGESS